MKKEKLVKNNDFKIENCTNSFEVKATLPENIRNGLDPQLNLSKFRNIRVYLTILR